MGMLTVNASATTLTIVLAGEITGRAADLAPAIEAAIQGWNGSPVVLDCTGVSGIGLDGAGLLCGVVRSLRWSEITIKVRRGPAGAGIRFLFERLNDASIRVSGAPSIPVVEV